MDYSSSLFTLNGEAPHLLPKRLRLPNGQTRYSHSISLEEVKACGYAGPFEIPSVSDTEKAEWDQSSQTYTVRAKTAEELKSYLEDKQVRFSIDIKIAELEAVVSASSTLLDAYVRRQYDLLRDYTLLKRSDNLLTAEDFLAVETGGLTISPPEAGVVTELEPSVRALYENTNKTQYKTQDELVAAYNEWYNDAYVQEGLEREYSTYGVIPYVPPAFRGLFQVKSEWTKGSTPLPADYLTPDFDYREVT